MPQRPGLPISLHVAGRRAVIVGEGAAADERRSRLEAAGAQVLVVAAADVRAEAFEGAHVVLCVDPDLGTQVAALRPSSAMIYVQDRPDLSDFSMPALARRGAIQVAISTEGLAPALARRLREQMETLLDSGGTALDDLLAEMARLREAGERDRLNVTAGKLRISGRIEIEP